MTLEYKPFNKLFDITAYVDPMELQTVSLEKWLKDQIEKIYVNNSDQLQNIAGLTITVISEHQGAAIEGYETGLNNLYDIIVEAFMSYRNCLHVYDGCAAEKAQFADWEQGYGSDYNRGRSWECV